MTLTCISNTPLTDEELIACLVGEADEAATEHLKACPACAERAQEYAVMQNTLKSVLYRIDCPDSRQIGEYYLNLLPAEQREAIRMHLARCPHCAGELADLANFLGDSPLPAEETPPSRPNLQILWEALDARRVIGRFFAGEAPSPLRLASVPLKGREPEEDELYRFSITPNEQTDIDAEFIIYQQEDSTFVSIHIQATIPAVWPQAVALQVTLTGIDWMLSQTTDEDEWVVFPNIRREELPSISFEITPIAP